MNTAFHEPLQFKPFGTDRTIILSDLQDAANWTQKEKEFWSVDPPSNPHLKKILDRQVNTIGAVQTIVQRMQAKLESQGSEEDRSQLLSQFESDFNQQANNFKIGQVITSGHPRATQFKALADFDVDSACILLGSCFRDGQSVLQSLVANGNFPWTTFVQHVLLTTASDGDRVAAMNAVASENDRLKTALDRALSEFNKNTRTWRDLAKAAVRKEGKARNDRATQWSDFTQSTESQWSDSLRVYNEKLALAAPATYWSGRAFWARIAAAIYGVAFCAVLGISLRLFASLGIPYLTHSATRTDASILTAVLPVIVPAFAVVWVLRIVGRLLAESMQLIQDAKERETMVKTFLALMNDEATGKTLVTDDDRLLILHSLFRPSVVSATDDSPPVHWFDILSRRYGSMQADSKK